MKRFGEYSRFAIVGLILAIIITLLMAFWVYPLVGFTPRPQIDVVGLLILLGIILLTVLGGIAGAIIGSRSVHEGGRTTQMVMAVVFALLVIMPLSCIGLWYAGW